MKNESCQTHCLCKKETDRIWCCCQCGLAASIPVLEMLIERLKKILELRDAPFWVPPLKLITDTDLGCPKPGQELRPAPPPQPPAMIPGATDPRWAPRWIPMGTWEERMHPKTTSP